MMRVAVLVSGGGTNLQALIDAQAKGELPSVELALVIASNAEAFALTRAERAGIPAVTVARRAYASVDEFDSALVETLRAHNIDIVVLAGFLCILGPQILQAFPDSIVNIHPSLIPSFCGEGFYGLKVHEAALQRGVKVTGATVHLVNEIVDGGEILRQKAVNILPGDTPEVLQRRVMEEAEWVILPQAVEALCASRLNKA